MPPYDETEGREYCDYHLHHGEDVGVPISELVDLLREKGFEVIEDRKYLTYGTDKKNPLYFVLKPFIDTEWLFIGRKR
ncbi:hypothetical protein AKJ66_03915 [candidate division MSBL1 archaeon SCGC-AAA259E22]|uniref:Uncharacterized protein n=1 Tax=candidate division MSBL1 archaeon SCGC-AAA259E22 TaxID=1698265 RepID=A0A133UEJ4_9EURY|nr:hypothetical protein AKJ66_03915 [candidate division MSBL1 archaeon SCGC-AAA259E22]